MGIRQLTIGAALAATGNDLATAARRARSAGLIDADGLRRVLAGSEGGAS